MATKLPYALGDRLRWARETLGKLTVNRAAERLCAVDPKTGKTVTPNLSRYETGARGEKRADANLIDRAAKLYGVHFDWLMWDRGPVDDNGTAAPTPTDEDSLDEILRAYPGRWTEPTVAVARQASFYKKSGGWFAFLEEMQRQVDPDGQRRGGHPRKAKAPRRVA